MAVKLKPGENTQADRRKPRLLGKLETRRSVREVSRSQVMIRAALALVIAILLLLAFVYAFAALSTMPGSFVISALNDVDQEYAIALSETEGFTNPTTKLNCGAVADMDNITYDWLPKGLDSIDGSHNGENYIAYSFYVGNRGTQPVDYRGQIIIESSTRHIEDAVRIMVYKNGKPTVYAKPQNGTTTPEPETTAFESDTIVMTTDTTALAPDGTDHYTVVIWLEGEDPECVDDIKGGAMGMRMDFTVQNDAEA